MPGMGAGHGSATSTFLAIAFHRSLLHQWFVILAVLASLLILWNMLRLDGLRMRARDRHGPIPTAQPIAAEPTARRFLRISVGGLWLLDGLLQSQAAIPASLANVVIKPVASASPGWAARSASYAIAFWNAHPVAAATSVFWVQIGLALWLLSASRGFLSQFAGYASACWALLVWILGEVFGGIFAPGYSWLFGAPGAALIYLVMGILVGLPDRFWSGTKVGINLIRVFGAFLCVMAALQAWPGRGFWNGRSDRAPLIGTLPKMMKIMAQSPQPRILRSVVEHMVTLSVNHGFGVNLAVVLTLGLLGCLFLGCRTRDGMPLTFMGTLPLFPFVILYLMISLFVWITVQDLGFFGGVGTDPNSMLPLALLLVGSYLATRPGASPKAFDQRQIKIGNTGPLTRLRLDIERQPTQTLRVFIAIGALFIILVGALPMLILL